MVTDHELAEVEAFFAEEKTLEGAAPAWGQSYGRDWTARWAVLDRAQIARGELCFSYDRKLERPSVVATFQKRLVYRLDLIPDGEAEPNPYGAQFLGIPAVVYGPHAHPWTVNREYVRINGFGDLPFREQMPGALKTVSQMLAAVSDVLNIQLTSMQRDFRPPAQGTLF